MGSAKSVGVKQFKNSFVRFAFFLSSQEGWGGARRLGSLVAGCQHGSPIDAAVRTHTSKSDNASNAQRTSLLSPFGHRLRTTPADIVCGHIHFYCVAADSACGRRLWTRSLDTHFFGGHRLRTSPADIACEHRLWTLPAWTSFADITCGHLLRTRRGDPVLRHRCGNPLLWFWVGQ